MVVGLTNRQWDGLRAATGLQVEFDQLALRLGVSLAREGARFKARNEITALLKPWFRAHRVEDFARSFDEHGVTWSVFRSFKQVVEEDPDCSTQNPMFSMLEQPGIGSYLAPGLPMEFGALHREPPRRSRSPRPARLPKRSNRSNPGASLPHPRLRGSRRRRTREARARAPRSDREAHSRVQGYDGHHEEARRPTAATESCSQARRTRREGRILRAFCSKWGRQAGPRDAE